jgi:AcrR family transcriptional regulator
MQEQVDLRIVKSRRAIKRAFFALMDEIGFSKISVRKIIDRAEINRSTFYAHYHDKFDLLDQLEDEVLSGFREIANESPIELFLANRLGPEAIMTHFSRLTSYIHDHGAVFVLLISEKGDPSFLYRVIEMHKSVLRSKQALNRLSIPQKYAYAAIFGMLTSVIAEWVNGGFVEKPDEFRETLAQLAKAIPENIFS